MTEEQADLLLEITEFPAEVALKSECTRKSNSAIRTSNGKKSKFHSQTSCCARFLSRVLPSSQFCLLHLARCGHLVLSTALFISTAQYGLLAHHWGSDRFSLLSFVGTISTVILVLLMGLRRFWDPSFDVHSELPIRNIVKNAFMFSVSLMGMSFCREKDHVPCYLQDSLFFLSIPFSIIYLTTIRHKGIILLSVDWIED